MGTINLFIMDMAYSGNTSGVDRYVATFLKGLEAYPAFQIHWIHLRYDPDLLFHTESYQKSCSKITIPLPQQVNVIIDEIFWTQKYNEQIFRLIKHVFEGKKNCILHLHTLNLIELAVYIRERIDCKIITHLHCIPWKGLYNTNIRRFNQLYAQYYSESASEISTSDFVCNHELRSYTMADHIICVTQCASTFLKKTVHSSLADISVIQNGIDDWYSKNRTEEKRESGTFNLLYVGVLSQSKGFDFILEAMREVQKKGYKVTLTIAGKTTPALENHIKNTNKDLTLNLLGRIPFEELVECYKQCDAGIIASLQEQSSYAAIEMAMFGLPIVTTAVDGLDEMFANSVNALKISTHFSALRGLAVNINEMADKIISLIESPELRGRLGKNIRKLYEKDMSLERMVNQTVLTYQKVMGGINYE